MPNDTKDDDNIAPCASACKRRGGRSAQPTTNAMPSPRKWLPPKLRAGAAVRPDLLRFCAAERAVFVAEVAMKDAEYALASRARRRHPHQDHPPQPICNRRT